jgi:hypothetical protein
VGNYILGYEAGGAYRVEVLAVRIVVSNKFC